MQHHVWGSMHHVWGSMLARTHAGAGGQPCIPHERSMLMRFCDPNGRPSEKPTPSWLSGPSWHASRDVVGAPIPCTLRRARGCVRVVEEPTSRGRECSPTPLNKLCNPRPSARACSAPARWQLGGSAALGRLAGGSVLVGGDRLRWEGQAEESGPEHAHDEHKVELVSHGHEAEVDQLRRDPEGPLCFERVPEC